MSRPLELETIANAMVAEGKGILAADESDATIAKRFSPAGIENTPENRREWRDILFGAKEAMTNFISGTILFEETLRQKGEDGIPFPEAIRSCGAVPGIKADGGAKPLAGREGELVTEGLDGLRERLGAWRESGARFAKWRAVISIGEGAPTRDCVHANAHALARYAALCQESAIVPIVEPEVMMDGPDSTHGIELCQEVTEWVLAEQFEQLRQASVLLEGIVLKPSMVVPGRESGEKASVEEVAERTVKALKRCVPASVPGIAFLSGGQSEWEATAHLSAMNAMFDSPWRLTFSYGRALQAAALKAWGGKPENKEKARMAFSKRAEMNALAAKGEWKAALEEKAA